MVKFILLDEAIASGDVNPDKVLRKRDRGDDQDPTARSGQGKKKRRKGKDFEPSKDKINLIGQILKETDVRNTKRKYYSSITKSKAARYELEGIEEMIPRLWSSVIMDYDMNDELGICH
ncbi:hypothetical protein Tco_0063050 [Tanacetum coccineum]